MSKMKQPPLSRVNKLYAEAEKLVPEYGEAYMSEAVLRRFAVAMRDICHTARGTRFKLTSADALWASVQHLLGKTMTTAMLKRNMMRIIANWHFIEEGVEIPMWDGGSCVTDVVFIGILRMKSAEGGQPKLWCKLKLKTGLCAGIIIGVAVPVNKIGYFLDHVGGLSRYHCNVEEIAGMQAHLTVYYEGRQLFIREWRCTEAQKSANRKLTEARSDIAKCTRSQPCNVCSADITKCNLAVWLPRKEIECLKKSRKEQSSTSPG